MILKRRETVGLWRRVRNFFWPEIGFNRAAKYMSHKVNRISGSPHAIALGFAAGAFASFTPAVGFHFVLAALIAWIVGYGRDKVGLTLGGAPIQLLVGLSGLPFGYLEYMILRPEPQAAALTLSSLFVPALILMVCTGFSEELIFRGIMQRAATETFGGMGWLYVAGIFAMMHMGHASWLDIPFVFGVSLFFSWVVSKTGSILGVTLAHGLTNIALFLVLPLLPQVSGMGAPLL